MTRRQPTLRLKRGQETARTHPWIFKGDVADVSDVEPGSAVAIVDAGGRFVGRGFYNSKPALCCRILTWIDEPLDAAFTAENNGRDPPASCPKPLLGAPPFRAARQLRQRVGSFWNPFSA